METHDVVVVGGGPAGSTCARRLRRAGVDVLVVDKAAFPRDKPCAGWITPAALRSLELSAGEYDGELTFQPFTAFETGIVGGGTVTTSYAGPVSYGILRREFDHFLLKRSGAPFRGGQAIISVRRAGGVWILDDEIRAPVVVGAGGTFCPVARALNGPARRPALVTAQELEFRLDARQRAACPVSGTTPRLYFTRDLRGYGWCVRKGEYLNVGLGLKGSEGLRERLRAFVAWLQERGEVPRDLPARWKGHAYLLHEDASRRVAGDGLLLAGDAAGLAVRESGEGIRPAIESGRLAAEAIVSAAGRPWKEEVGLRYQGALDTTLGRRARRVSAPSSLGAVLAPALLRSPWFARHVILDRWFLQAGRADGRSGRRAAAEAPESSAA